MSDINFTSLDTETAPIMEAQVTPTSAVKSTRKPTVKETNMSTSTTPTTVRTADLSAADKRTLVRLFGALPEAGSLALVGRKGDAKTQTTCECGCGTECPSRFVAGHDARLHSVLLSVSKGETPKSPNHRGFSVKTAKAELARRGW